jgi:chemotaxis protein CheC
VETVADARELTPAQLDALREVANIGAGHAATAMSELTGQRIMISVPRVNIAPLDDVPNQIAEGEEPVVAVLMQMMGDLSGLTLLVFPQASALRVASLMMRRPATDLGTIEQSAIQEAGNILGSSYMNALAEFMGMILMPSPPSLAVDLSTTVLSSTYVEVSGGAEYVFCVESEFALHESHERVRGLFLLLPDTPSLTAVLKAMRLE